MSKKPEVAYPPSCRTESEGAEPEERECSNSIVPKSSMPRDAMLDLLMRDMPDLVVGHKVEL